MISCFLPDVGTPFVPHWSRISGTCMFDIRAWEKAGREQGESREGAETMQEQRQSSIFLSSKVYNLEKFTPSPHGNLRTERICAFNTHVEPRVASFCSGRDPTHFSLMNSPSTRNAASPSWNHKLPRYVVDRLPFHFRCQRTLLQYQSILTFLKLQHLLPRHF